MIKELCPDIEKYLPDVYLFNINEACDKSQDIKYIEELVKKFNSVFKLNWQLEEHDIKNDSRIFFHQIEDKKRKDIIFIHAYIYHQPTENIIGIIFTLNKNGKNQNQNLLKLLYTDPKNIANEADMFILKRSVIEQYRTWHIQSDSQWAWQALLFNY